MKKTSKIKSFRKITIGGFIPNLEWTSLEKLCRLNEMAVVKFKRNQQTKFSFSYRRRRALQRICKLLYKLNGYKTGPVKGWYVVVKPTKKEYVVGQLCVDSSVYLFSDEKFDTENEAKRATELRALYPGLMHVT